MGEFYKIAERILERLENNRDEIIIGENEERLAPRGVSINEIRDAVTHSIPDAINFYPGVPGGSCHELAVFVSLNSPLYAKGRKHLKCRQAMEKIVQHMQGSCIHKTRAAVFVTDSWDEHAFADWKANLEEISHTNHFEIYLIAGRTISQIKI